MVAASVLVAGGGLAYSQAGRRRARKHTLETNGHRPELVTEGDLSNPKQGAAPGKRTRGGLKNVKVLAAILLTHIGKRGLREFLSLATISVSDIFQLGNTSTLLKILCTENIY